jgi:hypothetical protein
MNDEAGQPVPRPAAGRARVGQAAARPEWNGPPRMEYRFDRHCLPRYNLSIVVMFLIFYNESLFNVI